MCFTRFHASAFFQEEESNDAVVGRTRKFRDLRQRMQTEDEDVPVNNSPPDSQTSSIEGVPMTSASKTWHPFRIIEHDTLSLQSMTSLGRVGRILSGVSDSTSVVGAMPPLLAVKTQDGPGSPTASLSCKEDETSSGKVSQSSSNVTLPGSAHQEAVLEKELNGRLEYSTPSQEDKAVILEEPDVIASTKNNAKNDSKLDSASVNIPIAPPRRKKKAKDQTPTEVSFVYNDEFLKKFVVRFYL